MPTRYWAVDDCVISLVDRRSWITVKVDDRAVPVPAMTLGSWPLPVPDRKVVLEARRNLDAIRYQLYSDGYLVPRSHYPLVRRAPAKGKPCQAHETPAVTECRRCSQCYCRACTPDGLHCAACLRVLLAEERAAVVRLRRVGVAASLALVLGLLGTGLAAGSAKLTGLGGAGIGLVAILLVVSRWKERAEARAGQPPANET